MVMSTLEFNSLIDINPYLRLSVSESGDRDKEAIKTGLAQKPNSCSNIA